MPTPFLYRRLIEAFEERRVEQRLSMEALSDLAGLADRSWSKNVHADTMSGRMATIPTLDAYGTCLWPQGYRIRVEPTGRDPLLTQSGLQRLIRERQSARPSVAWMARALERRGYKVIPPDHVTRSEFEKPGEHLSV